jgi:hypothetical protein
VVPEICRPGNMSSQKYVVPEICRPGENMSAQRNYTPTDADFIPAQRKESRAKGVVKFSEPIQETHSEDESLDNTIFHLEESIKEKEALVVDLWKSLKLQKEELNFLKKKRDEQIEREMFNEDSENEPFESKQVNGLDDRLVIPVNIKVQGYLQYTLDAQLDTGAMNSYAKHGAIPSYYWQPIDISFRAVNKSEIKIKYIAPDFPILIQEEKVSVTLYCYDTGADILLGQDFVNKCLPFMIGNNFVQITVLGKTVKVPSKSCYETRIAVKQTLQQVEKSASSLIHIQKIIGHAEKHGMEMIKDIKEKIEV